MDNIICQKVNDFPFLILPVGQSFSNIDGVKSASILRVSSSVGFNLVFRKKIKMVKVII